MKKTGAFVTPGIHQFRMEEGMNDPTRHGNEPAAANSQPPGSVTRLLEDAAAGKLYAGRELLPLVYRSLRDLAERQMRHERTGHTLQATALVNEAYLRLVGDGECRWESRAHFYSAAAEAMRRILIEHARRVGAKKRGSGPDGLRARREIASVADLSDDASIAHALDIDEAIEALRRDDPRAASVVHLRFYTGLSIDETAAALGVAPSTVDREWRYARAWLLRHLGQDDETGQAP